MRESPHQHPKMITFSRENPRLLGKPTILGNPHIISIYFQRDVDIIWCWMLSTPSFSFAAFIFWLQEMTSTILSRKEPNLRSKHPRLLKRSWPALWWVPQLGFGAPRLTGGFWLLTQHFSRRNLYQTSQTSPAFSWGYVFRHLQSSRDSESWKKLKDLNLRQIAKNSEASHQEEVKLPGLSEVKENMVCTDSPGKMRLGFSMDSVGSNKKCQKWILEGATTRFVKARYMETRNPILSFGWSPASASQISYKTRSPDPAVSWQVKYGVPSSGRIDSLTRQTVRYVWRLDNVTFFSPRLSISTKWTLR